MGKKVIGILGSPRKKGHVADALFAVLESCQSKGYDTSLINLYDYNIHYCNGCMTRRSRGTVS